MKHPLVRIYLENKKHLWGLTVIVLISLISGVFKMLSATYWGNAVDFGIAGETKQMLISAGLMVLFILIDAARTGVHYKIIGHVTENMFVDLRAKAFDKLNRGDISVLERDFHSGDTATRINSDLENLNHFISGNFSDYSRRAFSALFAVIGCFFLSWQLSLAYCVILPLSLWAVQKISKPIEGQSKKTSDETGSAMNRASDALTGALTVKAFGIENEIALQFGESIDQAYQQSVRTAKIDMKLTGVKYTANVIQTLTLFLMGSWLVTNGLMTVGNLLAFVALSVYITDALNMIDRIMSHLRWYSGSAKRVLEVFDMSEETTGKVSHGIVSPTLPSADAQSLSFSYNENQPVLNDLNLSIPKGKRVAIIGASGCGKSTLVKLLCKFYLPQSGSLKIFGTDARDWDNDALRENLAIITQESVLLYGSIYENVAFCKPGTTRAECEQALREVGLWDFVCTLPHGMDENVGEFGSQLSGGQRQRICIARAMVKGAPLILLDEATSALDAQSEKEVEFALEKLLVGRSAVIVAHRLNTVQSADYIYCLENGAVLEEGTPTELLRRKGRYYEMCLAQGLVGGAQ